MTMPVSEIEMEISCPACGSEALYKYGKTKVGRQRYLCLICGKQFSSFAKKQEVLGKPLCPECGSTMHLYKIEGELIRFRCSNYPACKTFKKFIIQEEE